MSLESNIAALVAASTELTQAVNVSKATVEATRDSAIAKEAPVTTAKDAVLASTTAATIDASTTGTKLAAVAADYATQKTTKGLAAVQTSAESELKDRLHRRDPARHPFRGARPSLVMDFVRRECHRNNAAGNLEPVDLSTFMTFTRGSTATYVGPDGLIKTAGVNEARYGYDPVTGEALGLLVEEQRTNLITNSIHMGDPSAPHALTQKCAAISPSGLLDANKLTPSTVSAIQSISAPNTAVTPGVDVTFTICLKSAGYADWVVYLSNNGGADLRYGISINLTTGVVRTDPGFNTCGQTEKYAVAAAGNGWYRVSITLAGAYNDGTTSANIRYTAGATAYTNAVGDGISGVYFWGAQLEVGAFPTSYIPTPATFTGRASTKTYFDSNGVLQTAASGVAVTDYGYVDGRWVSKGLSLEPQATNLLTNGQGAGVATATSCPTNWAVDQMFGANIDVSAASSVTTALRYGAFRFSINGTTTATNRLLISPTNVHPGVASATTYTFAYVTRVVAGTLPTKLQPVFMWYDNVGALLSMSNGTEITPTTTETRYTTTVTSAVNAAFVRIRFDFTRYGTIGLVVNFTLDLGGLQFENGPVATSYIPTTTAQVTRAADTSTSAQVTRASDSAISTQAGALYNLEGGTTCMVTQQYVRGSWPGMYLWDGDYSIFATKGMNYLGGRGSAGAVGIGNAAVGASLRHALRQNRTTVSASQNASAPISATLPRGNTATVSRLVVGKAAPDYYNAHIRQLTYFPRQLSDADLQALTILED